MTGLTLRQAQVLAHIEACVAKDGYPPTVREVGTVFDITTHGAADHLDALARKNRIVAAFRASRGITILSPLTDSERRRFKLGLRRGERAGALAAPPTHRLIPLSRCSVCAAAVLGDVCPMCRAEVAA